MSSKESNSLEGVGGTWSETGSSRFSAERIWGLPKAFSAGIPGYMACHQAT